MRLSIPAFASNHPIPSDYTADGRDVHPALRLEDVPGQARSLALVVDDPDAPGGTWVHWTAWNIDPHISEIPEGAVPKGAVQGLTDFGDIGWGGPSPPPGKTHHYRFKAYALSSRLTLAAGAPAAELERAMRGKVLVQAEWVGTYARTR